jgi:hypothetical protein
MDSHDGRDESYGPIHGSVDDMPVLHLPTTFPPERIAAVVAVLARGIARQIVRELGIDTAANEED